MSQGSQILSQIIAYSKYAKYIESQQRRENYKETVERVQQMHMERFPRLQDQIVQAFKHVHAQRVLPSMRTMQFAGPSLRKNNLKGYNCSYLPLDSVQALKEAMYLLLCGTGVGYSVQNRHVRNFPVFKPLRPGHTNFTPEDSIEGWAEVLEYIVNSYIEGYREVHVNYQMIRPKGARLSSGAKAPGPEPLMKAMEFVKVILDRKKPGERFTSLDVHDIMCHASNAVLSGGVRRSAMIALFDADDHLMLTCKKPSNLVDNQQRYRANNSVFLLRDGLEFEHFSDVFDRMVASGSGEPGFFLSNHPDYGTNPCAEIGLLPCGLCNLTEINASNIRDQADFESRVWAATLIGTMQATYTDFPFVNPSWGITADEEALLGVSMTGIATGRVMDLDLLKGAEQAVEWNTYYAKEIGINPAARVTTVKPAGTTSSLLNCSSGVHAWHDRYYKRNVRFNVDEPIAEFLMNALPEFCEPSKEMGKEDTEMVFFVPVMAPDGATTRDSESAIELLERINRLYSDWVLPGHVRGDNTHNVSSTVNYRPDEWPEVKKWMWHNRDSYAAISCFPFDNGVYEQAPFESIDEQKFKNYMETLDQKPTIDLTSIIETDNLTDLRGEVACANGQCSL